MLLSHGLKQHASILPTMAPSQRNKSDTNTSGTGWSTSSSSLRMSERMPDDAQEGEDPVSSRGARGAHLTDARKGHALKTLRERIHPGVTYRRLMETYLGACSWDVDAAHKRWVRDRERTIVGDAVTSVPPAAPAVETPGEEETDEHQDTEQDASETWRAMEEAGVGFKANFEQERRDAALALRQHVRESTQDHETLSPSEAVLFLHLSGWDLDEARESFRSQTSARRRLAYTFDQMRLRLPAEIDRSKKEDTMAQDERLAEFVSITGRPDWYSLLLCLQEHHWNLVDAVSFWFMHGVAPFVGTPTVGGTRVDGRRVNINLRPIEMPTDQDCQAPAIEDANWGQEPGVFGLLDGEGTSPDEDDHNEGGISQNRKRSTGFLIDELRGTAKVRNASPRRFLVEYVSGGRYWFMRFKREAAFRWPQLEDEGANQDTSVLVDNSTHVLFDWNNQGHVDLLNTWRRQAVQRATGLKLRAQTQQWSKAENDFLYDLMEEQLAQLKQQQPDKGEDELLPMSVSNKLKQDWADQLNRRFTGTTQPNSAKPRIDRKPAALITQRARCRSIVDRFKVTPDKDWFAKQERKRPRAEEPVSQ